MTWTRRLVPAATVLTLAVLAVLPWGLPADARFVLPFLPVVAIFYWSARPGDLLSPVVPFVAGLLVDVLLDGPLGYWPLIYLGGLLLSAERPSTAMQGTAERWAIFAVSLAALIFAAWSVASLYHFAVADWRPFMWAAWCSALAYPLLVPLLRALDPEAVRASNDRFARGA